MLDRILEPIKIVMERSNILKDEIERVVMVGGSSMIPIVKQKVAQYFDNKVYLDCETNPQEIVALGAALLAF